MNLTKMMVKAVNNVQTRREIQWKIEEELNGIEIESKELNKKIDEEMKRIEIKERKLYRKMIWMPILMSIIGSGILTLTILLILKLSGR